ncbi:VOC family protein [Alcaligenaceae bacterium]|nr:VOC family protein [Alcaligenaceae bacterium]
MLNKLSCTFHHIGIACRDLDAESVHWQALGYVIEEPEFEDPVQRVRGRFLVGPGPRLELLTPAGPGSPVEGVIKRRNKMYHQAFEAPDFMAAISALEAGGARLVSEPASAVAFDGRRIAFLLLPNANLIEIIESPGPTDKES